MCASCGCGGAGRQHEHGHGHVHDHAHGHVHDHAQEHVHDLAHEHVHDHAHEHGHAHEHVRMPARGPAKTVLLEQAILAKNDRLATENRRWLSERRIAAVNLMSSPGAGKTTLLERTIRDLGAEMPIAVIEGDQETRRDADRIRAAGCRATQINTGTGCHLDAAMVKGALRELEPAAQSLLFIENVGNLVCPALFDLGERRKVVIASLTEGEDKPLKYPHMFVAADAMLLSKLDLAPHLDCNVGQMITYARQVNPRLVVFPLSARRGDGLDAWYGWLRQQLAPRAAG